METANFKQVYFTTNIPDDNGNYYYPVFIPGDVLVQYPLTDVAIDPSLGGHGLKFDWTANQWIVSSQDPTQIEIKKLQDQVKQQQTINLSLMTSAFNKASSFVLPNMPTTPNSAVSNMQSTAVSAPSTASPVADSVVSASDAIASDASAESASSATDAKGTN